MTMYAELDEVADFDSTVGAMITDRTFGGYEQGACIHSQGGGGSPSYGRKSLGAARSVLYIRSRASIMGSQIVTFLRGRDRADANDCWILESAWDGNHMSLTLGVYHNSGSETFTLTPLVDCFGICYPEIRIETGSGNGWAQAWINDEEVLEATRIPPNNNRTSYYLDAGVVAAAQTHQQTDLDMIKAADEYVGLSDIAFSPTTTKAPYAESLPGEKTDTKAVFKIEAYATGGWQDILPNLAGQFHVIETMELIPGRGGKTAIRDKNNKILWYSPAEWATKRGAPARWSGRGHAVQFATQIRIANVKEKTIIELGVRYAS